MLPRFASSLSGGAHRFILPLPTLPPGAGGAAREDEQIPRLVPRAAPATAGVSVPVPRRGGVGVSVVARISQNDGRTSRPIADGGATAGRLAAADLTGACLSPEARSPGGMQIGRASCRVRT